MFFNKTIFILISLMLSQIKLFDCQNTNYFSTSQQTKNSIFTLITTSSTSETLSLNGTTSLTVITTNSYIYSTFTFTFITTATYQDGKIIYLDANSYTQLNSNSGLLSSLSTGSQLKCCNYTNAGSIKNGSLTQSSTTAFNTTKPTSIPSTSTLQSSSNCKIFYFI